MRIAYVCSDPGVPVFGSKGCSVHVRAYLRAFLEAGHEVVLFARRLGGEPTADLKMLQVVDLGKVPAAGTPERELALLRANEDVSERLRSLAPFDVIYERHALWSHAAMAYAAASAIPGILEVNAPLVDEQAEHRSLHNRTLAEQAAEISFTAASRIVAVSDRVAGYLRACGVADEKILVEPNGVDVDRFAPAAEGRDRSPTDPFTIGFVGTLKPWHGLDHLFDAFNRLAKSDETVRLLLVGDGPGRSWIEAELVMAGLSDQATLTGFVPHSDVPGFLTQMDVAVVPYAEAPNYFSPLKLYEYMAAGLPIVASDVGQVSTAVRHGVNGLLYRPGSGEALVEAIERIRSDSALASRLGQAARSHAVERHTWSASVARVLDSVRYTPRSVAEVS